MIPLSADQLLSLVELDDEAAVRARAIAHDYASAELVQSALVLGRVLLYPLARQSEVALSGQPETAYERWQETTSRQSPYLGSVLAQWVTAQRGDFGLYPVFLYNRDFGATRRSLQEALSREHPPPPYLSSLMLNAFRQALGLSHDALAALLDGPFDEVARSYHRLLEGDALIGWLAGKRQPARFYGGATNTVLGMYDATWADARTGLEHLHRDAEARYDLGGGFNTAEIERLVGRRFVSADIVSPRWDDLDPELVLQVHRARGPRRVATSAERDAHRARQAEVQHLPLDVLHGGFPADATSYTIVSTGFLTSTVRPREHQEAWRAHPRAGLGHLGLSVHALARVLELVATGKSVDLFTLQRASSRVYKYKTALVQWRGGRIERLTTTDDEAARERWTPGALARLRAKLDPGSLHFARYAPPR